MKLTWKNVKQTQQEWKCNQITLRQKWYKFKYELREGKSIPLGFYSIFFRYNPKMHKGATRRERAINAFLFKHHHLIDFGLKKNRGFNFLNRIEINNLTYQRIITINK